MSTVKQLQAYLIESGLSVTKFAAECGLSTNAVNRFLEGGFARPKSIAIICNNIFFKNFCETGTTKVVGISHEEERLSQKITKFRKEQAKREEGKRMVRVSHNTWIVK